METFTIFPKIVSGQLLSSCTCLDMVYVNNIFEEEI